MDELNQPIEVKPVKPTDPLQTKPLPKAKNKFPKEMKLRHYENSVAKHIARIYVNKAAGDMRATVEWLKPGYEDSEYLAYADYLSRQEKVMAAIEEEYQAIGIDEAAKKKFIGRLWREILEGDQKTKQVAITQMGRALGIGEMADESRIPQTLPVKGMDKGWKQMTSGEEAIAAQNPTGFSNIKDEETLPEE